VGQLIVSGGVGKPKAKFRSISSAAARTVCGMLFW
jgi:hypothetical protein